MSRLARGPLVAIIVFCACTSLYLLYNFTRSPRPSLYEDGGVENLGVNASNLQKRQRVAVASSFGFHHDVYMTVAWSLARAMNRSSTGTVEVYADVPFNYNFQKVVDELGLYRHEYRHPDELLPALRNDVDQNSIDLVILGTCEIDLRVDWTKDLLSVWDERPHDRKFNLVCIVHNIKARDTYIRSIKCNSDRGTFRQDVSWQPAITEWSRRSAIRIVTIAEHVAHSFRESFNTLADSTDPVVRSAGYENIPIDVHVPILPLPNLPERPTSRPLSKAVIQGSFSMDRRDYNNIFEELNKFYDLMAQMDLCVPAFAENGYFQDQASSTFAMALQCNVPILVTQRTRNSYRYADDDRAVVTRPAAMREVAALKALRTGDASSFFNSPMPHMNTTMGSNRLLQTGVESMLHRGWTRTEKELDAFKIGLWKRNDDLAYRLLNDL
ncbi:hypothetical protein DXG01_008485 [Tephrocybe rancida]|nr:hypothetical protein DXG01_008485 [Tephrocybe rancida]